MAGSWFDRPWFFPTVIAALIVGGAFDLFGTFIYQPDFEHEANPISLTLRPYGLRLNWPMVIVGKALVCIVCACGLRLFLKRRRHYYPPHGGNFRESITYFFYGRSLGWFESLYRWPRSLTPAALSILAIWSLGGPYFTYLGYGNLASKYGWWQLGGIWVGRYWIDWSLPLWLSVECSFLFWQLWRDFQAVPSLEDSPTRVENP